MATGLALSVATTLTLPAEAAQRVVAGRYPGTQDNDTMAVGANATATGAGAVSVGTATSNGEDALALGTDASATGTETVAIGGATAGADYGIAIGQGSVTGGAYSGTDAIVGTAYNAVAIGLNATAYGHNDVVIGANQTAMTPTYAPQESSADGGFTSANGGRVMIGHDNIAYGRAGNSILVGSQNRANSVHGIAIGQNASVGQAEGVDREYENNMAIGTNTRSYASGTIAIGNGATAGNNNTSTAAGDNNGELAIAIGQGATASTYYTIAMGGYAQATGTTSTAIGRHSQATKENSIALGNESKATGLEGIAIGVSALASGERAMAAGRGAQATGVRSNAYGFNAVASGGGGLAQGTNTTASSSYTIAQGYDTTASGGSSIAQGYITKALGTRSIAIGREVVSGAADTGQDTIAIGYQTNATAQNAIAIGKTAKVDASATDAMALGSGAAANVSSSVAIGSGSSTTRATDTTGQGWNNQDSTWSSWLSTKGNAGTTGGGVWNSTAGVVSLGTDGASGTTLTRKLTGLAAGQYDTDAVNMKQWTNTMLATTGDFKDSSYSTTYGSDGTPRTVTKLLNQSLKITGGVDNTLYYQSDFAAQPNIGAIISDNTVTLRLNKTLRGLETIYLTNPTTGNATTLSGNGITIRPKSGSNVTLTATGLNNGGNKITNVAAGTAGTDGVNVNQLNQAIAGVSGGSGTTTTVTVEGGTAAGTDGTYTGNNLQLTSTTGTGTATYDLKLADNVTLGSTGTGGTDGALTVNGKDGESIAINGSDGTIALTGADGSTATIAAGTAANDVNGNSINRITAGGATVATLNDGMVYTGDTGSAAVKLNKTVNIVGGETDASKLSTDNNIGIVAAQDGDNGKLTVRLAKDITGLNTVTAGDATIGTQTETTAGGVAQTGSYVTGLDNTTWNVTNPDIVTGRAATEDQLKTVSDAVVAVTDGTSENATGGFALSDDSGTAVKQDLGKTIQIAGDGNVTTTAGDGKITVGLSNTVALGDKGTTDGSMTVNGADGSSVAINGSNGSIVMNTADGSPVTIQAGTGANDVTGSPINRITVGGVTVATLNDGTKYGGDFGTVSNVKLNNQVDVKGEATTEADLTTGNIGVVSGQNGDNGLLTVKLNKDINLGSTGSLTFGSGDNTVSLSNGGLNNGGNKITNVATGTEGTDAVNVDQLTKAIAGVSAGEGSKTNLTVEGGTAAGTGGNYTGSNLQVTEKTETTGATTYDVKLADNITLGSAADSAAGTEGTDSSITVNGKDGSAVAINGADGSIALNTADGSPVTIQAGTSANNLAGNPVDRIIVGGQTVATMSDGLTFAGDDGQSDTTKIIPKALNEQLDIVGGAEGDLTDKNIGVNNVNGQLKVQLVKDVDLGSTGSLTLGNTVVNNNGITITPATGNPVSLTGSGLDNGNNVISNVATGVKGTDAVNVDQLTKAIQEVNAGEGSKTRLTVEGGTVAGTDGNYAGSNLQVTEKAETNGSTTYDVKLADNLTLGKVGTDGVDGSVTVNGKDGSSVAVNGADGSITAKGADGSAVAINGADGSIGLTGSNGTTTTIKGGTGANDVNGNAVDRITVGDQTVATLNDGMVYTGDTGSAAVKLNKTVNIVGGETDSSKLSTDNNIGIVAAQDGDNGKLTVRLAKDITGLNTVTAGDATIGTQTETTANGVAQTGSYVTGLDNTEWNVADPDIVTGRAATEDQLKTVSDAVTAVSDGTSENATGGFGLTDGSGTTVKQDLGKTITVKGGVTDGTATTENPDGVSNITTAVKDGALEVSLNKDLDLGSTGSVTTGNTVINNDGVNVGDTSLTTGGLTITNGPSVTTGGIDGGSKQITNVASGSDGVDADGNPTYNNLTNGANIGDIKNITDAAKTELTNDGLNFTADSGDSVHRNLGETLNIAGDGNITTTSDATNGKITVGLSDTIALGEKASEDGTTEGTDGSITVNGKDGSAVAINGADGSIALNTGSSSPITIQAGSSVNDVTGTPVNRITVGGQTVATMNDGMKYGGDFGTVSNVKLNNQVDVKGEATTEANLTTGNIGVVSGQAGDNGLLTVKLNKDINLGENGSVTTGNTVINNSGLTITNGPSVTSGGINAGGSKITNVATGTDGTDAVNVAQLEDRISKITIGESKTTEITVEGGTAAPTDGTYAGDNLQVKAGTTENGSPTYDVKLADNITLGSAADSAAGTTGTTGTTGTDSSVTVNGANGSSVAIDGANGSVTAKGTDGSTVAINGADGSIVLNTGSGSPVTIKAGTSANNLAGTSVDRISVSGETVATMSDGLKYAGDDGQTDTTKVIAKNLNEQIDIVGGAEGELTDKNIGVNNVNGQLKVQLVKDLKLGDTGSVSVGTAVLGNRTVTTAGGVSQTGTYLTGLENTAWDTSNPDIVTGRAATEDQLKAVNDKVNSISAGIGAFGVTDDNGIAVTQDLGENIQIAGDGNITTTADADGKKLTVGLSNDISVGTAGTDGVDGKIGINGKDGSSVVINGADGSIGLTGPAGEDGTPGTTVTIKAGDSVNNVDGDSVDRITAGGQTIATMSDGQKYAGDNAKEDGTNVIAKKLNEQLDIVGGADATKLTENNIGVNNVNGQLKVQLAQNIDLGKDGSITTGATAINNDGVTITPSAGNPVSLTGTGLNNGGNTITNVGAGTADTDAVNYGQLKAAATAVTVEGGTAAGTTDYAGSNLKLKATTVGDKTTYDLKLADNLSIGTKGEDGADGSIGINGKDGSSVVINGTDGISVKGADGKDGVTISGKDGVDCVDGAEGHIGLNGKDGMTDIYTTPGQPGVNGQDGETMTRIIYTDPNGANHEVATLDDGMKYTGDTGSAAVALNKTVNIVGGETDSTKLSTDNNIGIVAEQDGDNGKLTVRLAKDITGLNTVTAGKATIGNQTETTASGVAETGSYVTGLDNTTWNVSNPDIVTGRGATEDQLKTVSDAVKAVSDGTGENATGGFGLTDDNGNAVKQDLGKTIQIAGDGQNITTTADAATGKLTVALSNDLSIGTKGADGSIGVNGKDGSSIVINGSDGSIDLTGPAGEDGTPGTTVNITAGPGVNDVTGTPVDRITAGGQTVATLSDGMKYGGDFGTVSNIKLNNQVDVKGEATSEANLTTGNIGVVSGQNGDNGLLTVKLNKDINLGSTGSVTIGNTVVNNIGMTIGSGDKAVRLTNGGLNNGGNQITKVGSGSDGVDADGNPTYNTDTNGANIGDVKNITETAKSDLTDKGMDFTADSGEIVHRDLGEALGIVGDGQNITTTTDPTNGKISVGLSNALSIGAKGADGKDGVDGSIGVNGKDGSSVVINGTDGISVKGSDGKDGVTISGKDGADGVDGAEGHIGLNGKDGMTDIWTTPGQAGVNGKDGDTMTRIIYTDPNGANHEVATLDDGMKYTGDTGSAAVKLNKVVNIVGGETDSTKLSTGNNIGIVAEQDGDNGKLTVQLAKDITGLNTVEAGTAVIGNQGVVTVGKVAEDGNFVTGLDNTTWNVSNPDIVSGRGATEDQLKTVSDAVKAVSDGTGENATGGFGLTDDNGNAVKQDLGKTIQIAGDDQNITTTADTANGKITVGLSNNLSIGTKGTDGAAGANGSIAVNGSDGNSVAIDGNEGISIKGADGKDGVTITGKDGIDGVDGLEGHIGLNGKDGMTDIWTTPGDAGINGAAGDTMTRIIYTDPEGTNHQVATLDDGMKYSGDFGDTSKVKLNNQVNVKGNATTEADLTDGNIGVVSGQDGDNGQLLIKLNKDLDLGATGSVTMGNTVINNSGVTINGGTSPVALTNKGLDNGGNQIVNVASGIDGKSYDTTVSGQENYNNAASIGDLSKAVNIAVDDIKDAAKGGGFALSADDNNSVKQNLGDTIAIAGDGNTVTSVSGGKLVVGLNKDVDLGTDGSLAAGNTTIDKNGVSTDKIAIKDSEISIDKDGINAGNTQIKNVGSGADGVDADGKPTYNTDTNGANIGDVKNIANAAADAAKAQSGKNITVTEDHKVNLNDDITLGDDNDVSKQVNINGKSAAVTAGSGDNQVKMDGSKGQISAGGAVLGNQENTAGDKNPATGSYLTGLSNTEWNGENIQSGRAATEDQLKTVSDKVNKGRVFQGDDGEGNSVTVGLGDTLKLNGGADSTKLSDGNIGVVRNNSGDGLDIKLAKDLKGLDSVTTGNTTMNNSGVTIKTSDSDRTITIQDGNVNMGNNVISGVADGTVAPGSTEAVNGSQLAQRDQSINIIGGAVNKLDDRINKVGAGAAALAALHPQDFDPDDKWDFAFGYGHYRGANAGALGAFYKPNEDTTFSVGGTFGGGDNMVNAGVSFKLGQGNNVSNSRVGMAKEIKHLREDVAKLEDIVNRQSEMINQLTGRNPGMIESKGSELFPDVPSNHWAYEYVTKLHNLGILEGYPDGNFDGNRMMTRYEFAAIVYRAIMAGAASNAALAGDDTLDRLANEFSAELKYIRIDTVRKDKDGNPTIQRVRIVPENKDKY